MADKFYDIDGNECTLEALCHREPGWAANRIRHERAQLALARKALAAAEEMLTAEGRSEDLVNKFITAMAEVRKVENDE